MKEKILKPLYSSMLSGILIGCGCLIYMSSANPVVGSCLFSFGLITIVLRGYLLYTGKIGYAWDKEILKLIPIILVGNLLGSTLLSCIVPADSALITKSIALTELKLVKSFWQLMFDGICCGVMMYLAVDGYRIKNNLLLLVFPVMIFILCGFEHSIADMLYLACAGQLYTIEGMKFIGIVALGNAIGALFFSGFHREITKG
ncbi:MAG: formate/nitrite transporter family protein [Bacteroidales bacterium]|nr:formate/nitrite transporter family protein [Bacteroidales bacterium]